MMATKASIPNEQVPAESVPLTGHANLINAIDWAVESYRNAETLIQSRLNNFLFAASILFLAWATIYVSAANGTRIPVLITLSVLGAVFSIFWWLLALRQSHFFTVTMDTIIYFESFLDVKEFRITTVSSQLQKGNPVTLHTQDKIIRLGFLDKIITSRSLVILAPAVFGISFLILVAISIIAIFQ